MQIDYSNTMVQGEPTEVSLNTAIILLTASNVDLHCIGTLSDLHSLFAQWAINGLDTHIPLATWMHMEEREAQATYVLTELGWT